jgi:hypothetical protein
MTNSQGMNSDGNSPAVRDTGGGFARLGSQECARLDGNPTTDVGGMEMCCQRCGGPLRTGRKYCSYVCKYAASKRPATTHTQSRRNASKAVGAVCEACPSTKDLMVHHVDINPLNNSPENLQTLCNKCHTRWHWIMRKGLVKTPSKAPYGLRYTRVTA